MTGTWADLLPETREHAHRRGYRDGWIVALEAIWDAMMGGYSRSDACDLVAAHGDGPLREWVRRGTEDAAPGELPPEMVLPPRRRGRA